ncbi:hypothetical protein KP001_14180 [Geomonas subterranea]|uniref:Cytochrome c domain-containing protein n=1 Tax=Geomonas subterranea TaxID=2847989 RepID=A0ABX8LD51_9BACT|nr:hypothetical protein [Geomonas subterranea]QXE89582.1 hypothetical protein KP001_14180 [Geomonas subterranea]QXM08301.1 hypothetical protein KP002_15100 [Geomonas subterranea]
MAKQPVKAAERSSETSPLNGARGSVGPGAGRLHLYRSSAHDLFAETLGKTGPADAKGSANIATDCQRCHSAAGFAPTIAGLLSGSGDRDNDTAFPCG